MTDNRFNFIIWKLNRMMENAPQELVDIWNALTDRTEGMHINGIEELGGNQDEIDTSLSEVAEYCLTNEDDLANPAIKAILTSSMKYGLFEAEKNSAIRSIERMKEWHEECDRIRAENPAAEEDPELLPPCPASTTAMLEARRTLYLWENVYAQLLPRHLEDISRYPIHLPRDVRDWKDLKDEFGLSWNELRTLLQSVKSLQLSMEVRECQSTKY